MPNLFVIVSMMSGLESFVKREVEALADRGYAIHLLATKYQESPGFQPRADIPVTRGTLAMTLVGLALLVFRHPRRLATLMLVALRLNGLVELALAACWWPVVRRGQAQGIHCAFGDRKFFVGYFLHRLTDLPLTVAIHAHEIYAQPNVPLFREALAHTSAVITISEKNRHLLRENFDVPDRLIHVVRLTVDVDFWTTDRPTTVLTVARFTPRKGWDDLFAAARMLGTDYHFVCVGFGSQDIQSLAHEFGVEKQVTVFGKLRPEHIRVLMRGADIFCLPSKPTREEGSEGIPVVLMEAMATGIPVVATNDGSVSELVEQGIVPAGNPDALAKELARAAGALPRRQGLDRLDSLLRSVFQ